VERGEKEKILLTNSSVHWLSHRFVKNFIFDSFLIDNRLFFDAGLLPGSLNRPVGSIIAL